MDNFDLKKYLVENKVTTNSRMLTEASTLSPAEDRIYRDIIAELDTLTEATFSQILDKVKEYAKKGLMTAAIVSALLTTPGITAAQAADIRQASGVETSTPGSTSSLQKTLDPISQLKKDFSGTSFTTGKYEGGSSINWGKGKPVGVFVTYDMGQPTIKITVLGANGKTSPNFNKIADDAKQLGGEFNLDSKNAMAEITVAKEKLPDIQKFIEASLPLMR